MLELIIALLLSLGIVSSADDVTNDVIQENKTTINAHIIDDDIEID
jgi:archaellum component FlaF (FlaF/FlaG flagellin family)